MHFDAPSRVSKRNNDLMLEMRTKNGARLPVYTEHHRFEMTYVIPEDQPKLRRIKYQQLEAFPVKVDLGGRYTQGDYKPHDIPWTKHIQGLYRMPAVRAGVDDENIDEAEHAFPDAEKRWLQLLHVRFGHMPMATLKKLPHYLVNFPKSVADALEALPYDYKLNCPICAKAKMKAMPQKPSKESARHDHWGSLISSDLNGPLPVSFQDKYEYCINFVDAYSGWHHVYGMKTKSGTEVAYTIAKFIADTSTFGDVKHLLTDDGNEFRNKHVAKLLLQKGIGHTYGMAYAHSNARAERGWSVLNPIVRSMFGTAQLNHVHWPSAYRQAAYVVNITPRQYPHLANDEFPKGPWLTPYYLCKRVHPDAAQLLPWGCEIFARVPNELRISKLEFVGVRG